MTTLPNPHLILRQPAKACEVVFIRDGIETVLFSGKRWPARHALLQIRTSAPYKSIPVFVRKKSGAVVPSNEPTV